MRKNKKKEREAAEAVQTPVADHNTLVTPASTTVIGDVPDVPEKTLSKKARRKLRKQQQKNEVVCTGEVCEIPVAPQEVKEPVVETAQGAWQTPLPRVVVEKKVELVGFSKVEEIANQKPVHEPPKKKGPQRVKMQPLPQKKEAQPVKVEAVPQAAPQAVVSTSSAIEKIHKELIENLSLLGVSQATMQVGGATITINIPPRV